MSVFDTLLPRNEMTEPRRRILADFPLYNTINPIERSGSLIERIWTSAHSAVDTTIGKYTKVKLENKYILQGSPFTATDTSMTVSWVYECLPRETTHPLPTLNAVKMLFNENAREHRRINTKKTPVV